MVKTLDELDGGDDDDDDDEEEDDDDGDGDVDDVDSDGDNVEICCKSIVVRSRTLLRNHRP